MKFLFLGISLFILLSGLIVLHVCNDSSQVPSKDNHLYQGPVPEGYDEDYFRHTGITKPLGDKQK